MPRAARIVIPGCPHHITQRGNNRQDVFFTDDDRVTYLKFLRNAARRCGLRIEGYCLMTNHVHLVATPAAADSLALAMGRANQFYTQYVNRRHGRSGHLWQDRFFSCPLDEERNPVRAGLVRRARRWPWSSAAAHCDGADKTGTRGAAGLLNLTEWAGRTDPGAWHESLVAPQDEQVLSKLRLCTTRNRPLGGDPFVSKLERKFGRRLRPLPHGRPRKTPVPDRAGQP